MTNKDKSLAPSEPTKNQATVTVDGSLLSFACDKYLLGIETNFSDPNIERYFPSFRYFSQQNPPRAKVSKMKTQSSSITNKNTPKRVGESSSNGKPSSKKTKKSIDTKENLYSSIPAYQYTKYKEERDQQLQNQQKQPVIPPTHEIVIKQEELLAEPQNLNISLNMDEVLSDRASNPPLLDIAFTKPDTQPEASAEMMTADEFNMLLDSFDDWNGSDGNTALPQPVVPNPEIPSITTPVAEQTIEPQILIGASPSLTQTSDQNKPIDAVMKEFKEELEAREVHKRAIQDLHRSFTEENLIYEPQIKTTSLPFSNILSTIIDTRDEKLSAQEKVQGNNFMSYFSTPMYTTHTQYEGGVFSRLTNYAPTCNDRVPLVSSLITTSGKDEKVKMKRKKKEDKPTIKKEEAKEPVDQTTSINAEENYDEEITSYNFDHCAAENLLDFIPSNLQHITLSEVMKKVSSLVSDYSNQSKSDLSAFILNGCWKGSELSSTSQRDLSIPSGIQEIIQVISRNFDQFNDHHVYDATTEEMMSVLFKMSDVFSRISENEIKGPVRLESSAFQSLETPTVRVGYMEQWLDSNPEIIVEWEKSLLEPYAEQKKINYCVIGAEPSCFNFKESFGVYSDFSGFFENLSTIYETCKLGMHIPISNDFIHDGIVPFRFNNNQIMNNKSQKLTIEDFINQLQNSAKQCEQGITSFLSSSSRDECILIYVVFPFHLFEKIELSNTIPVSSLLYNIYGTMIESIHSNLSQTDNPIIPVVHLIDQRIVDEPYVQNPLATLKHISLSIYNKCRRQQRWDNLNGYFSLLHEPYAILTPMESNSDSGNRSNSRSPFSELQQQKLILHCGYSMIEKDNGDFLVTCTWSDNTGSLLESIIFDSGELIYDEGRRLEAIIQKIHEQSTIYMTSLSTGNTPQHSDPSWEYIVCKVAPTDKSSTVHMTEEEFAVWSHIKGSHSSAMYIVTLDDHPHVQFFKEIPLDSSHESSSSISSYIHLFGECGYIISSLDERNQENMIQEFFPKTVVEVRLFVKENERGLHMGNVRHVCRQFNNLSWLSVSPLFPGRCSVLPVHLQLLRNINTNTLRYIQYLANKTN